MIDQIAALRRQIDAAMPNALRDDDAARRVGMIVQLEQIAEQAAASFGAPWQAFAAYLRVCAALLRGQPYDRATLAPADVAQIEAWEQLAYPPDTTPDPIVELAETIVAWIDSPEDDAARAQALPALVDACAGLVIEAARADDADAAEALAQSFGALRDALRFWPTAEHLPPYGALLGCFQALLRGAPEPLERIRARLDAPLAATLAEVERLIGADEATLQAEARDRQIAVLRRQVEEALQSVCHLSATDPQRADLAAQLEHLAAQAAADEPDDSPWLALAADLRASAAQLRAET